MHMHQVCLAIAGVVLEEAERVIKAVITEDDLLPMHCKGLTAEQWGIELADYFECVSGEAHSCVAFFWW